jgi:cell division protein ZapA
LKKPFQIKILGQEFTVMSDSGDEHVEKVVKYLSDKVDEIGKSTNRTNNLNIAILAALNIADEYIRIQGFKEEMCSQVEKRTENIIRLIDNVR